MNSARTPARRARHNVIGFTAEASRQDSIALGTARWRPRLGALTTVGTSVRAENRGRADRASPVLPHRSYCEVDVR